MLLIRKIMNRQVNIEAQKILQQEYPDSETIFLKAANIMLLKADRCLCDVPVGKYYVRVPNKFQFKCTCCKIVVSPLSVTPLQREHKELTDTLDLTGKIYHNKGMLPFAEIACIYRCKYETAVRKARRVIQWMELSLTHSGNSIPTKNINDNKVVRMFCKQHDNLIAAVDSLFHALPSLRLAMKNNSIINNQNNKSHANSQN
jgi:hypothetical protein